MSNIVAFLADRLDEDELAAREASIFYDDHDAYENGVAWRGHGGFDTDHYERFWLVPHLGVINHVASGRHIVRHNPKRVLTEVKAKRRIVSQHAGTHECPSPHEWELEKNTDHVTEDECWTLRALAEPYGDHSDYDPAWALT